MCDSDRAQRMIFTHAHWSPPLSEHLPMLLYTGECRGLESHPQHLLEKSCPCFVFPLWPCHWLEYALWDLRWLGKNIWKMYKFLQTCDWNLVRKKLAIVSFSLFSLLQLYCGLGGETSWTDKRRSYWRESRESGRRWWITWPDSIGHMTGEPRQPQTKKHSHPREPPFYNFSNLTASLYSFDHNNLFDN